MPDARAAYDFELRECIPLREFVGMYCRTGQGHDWQSALGSASKTLLGPGETFSKALDISATTLVVVCVSSALSWLGGESGWGVKLVFCGSALAFAACVAVRRRGPKDFAAVVEAAGVDLPQVQRLGQLHEHFCAGRITAYQASPVPGVSRYVPVDHGYWRALYGWLGLLGRHSRWFGIFRISNDLFVRGPELELSPVGADVLIGLAARDPKQIARWSRPRRQRLKQALIGRLGASRVLVDAFAVYDEFEELEMQGLSQTKIFEEMVKRRRNISQSKSCTMQRIVSGQNDAFNSLLRAADTLQDKDRTGWVRGLREWDRSWSFRVLIVRLN